MNIDIDIISNWLSRIRWWPKNTIPSSYEIEYVDEYIFLWIIDSRGNRYFIPLKKICGNEKQQISTNRAIDIGNIRLVEAEFVEPFLIDAERVFECEHIHELRSKEFSNIRLLTESSNIVTLAYGDRGDRIVLKSYRHVLNQNNEVHALKYLASMSFSHIPTIYSICRYKGFYIGLVLEYINGVDGGSPFYNSLIRGIRDNVYGYVQDLGHEVGRIVAKLHTVFALNKSGVFDYRDIDSFNKKIEIMARELLIRLDHLHSEQMISGLWIELVDKRIKTWIETAIEMLNLFNGLKKIWCHQDLHLGQMVYSVDRGFVITDFEGEPISLGLEQIDMSPSLRDIASIARSLDYIVFSATRDTMGLAIEETAIKLTKTGWGEAKKWRDIHMSAIVKGYTTALGSYGQNVIGLNLVDIDLSRYITPWYIYRALYEALYEAIYRPQNLPIPLHILVWNPRDMTKGIGEIH